MTSMKLRLIKNRFGIYLMDGENVRIGIDYLLSLNHLNRIQDIGYEILVYKANHHSSMASIMVKFFKQVEEEVILLSKIYKGKDRELFYSRGLNLPQNVVGVQITRLSHTEIV
jgi:hypothetical protein